METMGKDLALKAKVGSQATCSSGCPRQAASSWSSCWTCKIWWGWARPWCIGRAEWRCGAYQGTEVFGFEFPYEMPERRGDENLEEVECAGLEWIEERGLRARDNTLKIPGHMMPVRKCRDDHASEVQGG